MKDRIHIVTLGVSDLARATAFYRDGLRLPQHEQQDEGIVFFALRGTWLALFPRAGLAGDAAVSPEGSGFPGFTLGHLVDSPRMVDELLETASSLGATITQPAIARPWGGYSGYFRDLDGYLWEVAWMERPLPIEAAAPPAFVSRSEVGSREEREAPLVTEVVVPDLDRTVAALLALGFLLERKAEGFAVLRWAGAYLFVAENPAVPVVDRGMHIRVVVAAVDDIPRVAQAAGLRVTGEPRDREYGLRDCTVMVPGGLEVRFAQVI